MRAVKIYNQDLRWRIDPGLPEQVQGKPIERVTRRGKYLLLHFDTGLLVLHLGMTGRLVRSPLTQQLVKHDHVDFLFDDFLLRYHDPRRFGSIEWHAGPPETYRRFASLGPEPLSLTFTADYLSWS